MSQVVVANAKRRLQYPLRRMLGVAAVGLILSRWAVWQAKRKNQLSYNEKSEIVGNIMQKLKGLLGTYSGPCWLPFGLLQTALTEVLPKPQLPFRREVMRLPVFKRARHARSCCPEEVPEGIVSIDWLESEDKDAPIVIIVPGLTGDSSSGYVARVAKSLWTGSGGKFRIACYNPRGRGGNAVETPFLYSVGYTEDLRRVVDHIADDYPNSCLVAAGFSLGSNYLAKYVAEEGANCKLTAAGCFACPVDCLNCSHNLATTFVGKLSDPLLVSFCQKVRSGLDHILKNDPRYDIAKIAEAKTMHDFDGAVIAPMFGFSTASEYYRWSSAGLLLQDVRRPILFVHAQNDPIINASMIKTDDFARSEFLIHCLTYEGGHSMDWCKNVGLNPWIGDVASEFFMAAIENRRLLRH